MPQDVSSWLSGLLGPVTWKENGTAKAARAILNFVGVTITDNGSDQLTFTVNPSSLSGLAAGMATFLATPTSANLRSTMTDETGTGALMFAPTGDGVPKIVAGVLQAAAAKILNADVDAAAAIALSKLAAITAEETITLTGVQDDLVLATPSTVKWTHVRFTDVGGIDIGSIAGGVAGRLITLSSLSAAGSVILRDEAGLRGTAANRYAGHAGVDITIAPSGTATFYYDAVSSLWRPLGRST